MSETLCTLRTKGGGGGRYKETSLWTNSSPSSNFSAQTITLSDNLSNYKYVAIRYKYSPSTSDTDYSTDILSVDDFKKCIYNPSAAHNSFALLVQAVNNNLYARTVFYDTDTSIQFTNYTQIGGTGSGVGNTIPLEILGLNELDHGKRFDETTLWTNNAPTSSWNTDPISLNDDISNYDYIKIVCRKSNISADECQVLCPVSEFKTYSTSDGYGLSATIYVSSYYYTRRFRYGSNTQVIVNNCYKYSASSGTTSAISLLPIRIVGCKFR